MSITKTVPVPPERRVDFEQYVRQQQTHQRYPKAVTNAQLQDIYLSDPKLPSHSGAITGDFAGSGYRHSVYVEIPAWAARLRFLRDQNYTLTDRGRVFLLASHNLLTKESFVSIGENPLALNVSERYVSLFSLLDSDGDFIAALYRHLLPTPRFTRADAGQKAILALEDLRASRLKNTSAGSFQVARIKIDRTIAAAKKQKGTGLGPRESIATSRIEPLVDCGILSRPRSDAYEYTFTDWGKQFLTAVTEARSITEFLADRLSAMMSILSGHPCVTEPPPLNAVAGAYRQLRSGLGYVSLRELAIATVAESLLSESTPLFEIAKIEESLKRAASEKSRYVRLALGRAGGIAQIRIDQRIFDSGSGD